MLSNDGLLKKVDVPHESLDDIEMDALKERVLDERIQLLQARLALAILQRNVAVKKYFGITRRLFEAKEHIDDLDRDIEEAKKL